ncbi:MAG: RidA family protein [Nitrospirales bacterium]|nr:RidA family protein [Nitrospirales bacterium]
MNTIENRLAELGITLSGAPAPLGSYVPCVRTGNLLFLSGILPLREGKLTKTGRVGESVSLEEAQEEGRQVAINAISALKANLGSLDRVVRVVKLNGYVASGKEFFDQPKVLNATSDLIFQVFGEAGRHARAAVGVYTLPLNSPVEVDFIVEIKD